MNMCARSRAAGGFSNMMTGQSTKALRFTEFISISNMIVGHSCDDGRVCVCRWSTLARVV